MTPGEELTSRFRHEDNCVHVGAEADVQLYFRQFTLALSGMMRVIAPEGRNTSALAALTPFLTRLANTYRTLQLRYRYNRPGDGLKIDTSDSGFVHFSTLLDLEVDLAHRAQRLGETPATIDLKRRMVQQVAKERIFPRQLQEQISYRLYLENLVQENLFWEFNPGPLTAVGEPGKDNTYVWSFATYDRVLNRPFIYLIYLRYDCPGSRLTVDAPDFQSLVATARTMASGRQSLLVFSKAIDDLPAPICPRIVNRFIIGPYFSKRFTLNEQGLEKVFDNLTERNPFVFSWEAETLVSDREFRVGEGLFSTGKLKQVFWTPHESGLMSRGVSHVERNVLVPHWFAQYLGEAGLFTDHRQFTIDKEDGVYGIH